MFRNMFYYLKPRLQGVLHDKWKSKAESILVAPHRQTRKWQRTCHKNRVPEMISTVDIAIPPWIITMKICIWKYGKYMPSYVIMDSCSIITENHWQWNKPGTIRITICFQLKYHPPPCSQWKVTVVGKWHITIKCSTNELLFDREHTFFVSCLTSH